MLPTHLLPVVHGMSAIKNDYHRLPSLAFFALGAVGSGAIIGKTRYLQPYELLSGLIDRWDDSLLHSGSQLLDGAIHWPAGAFWIWSWFL
jgi:hypothetical protein